MRIVLRLLALLVPAALLFSSAGTALQQSVASVVSGAGGATSFYVVRPDPRLCPSPLCGGYWVSRANYSRTRCHDGLLRPRCYVASAVRQDRRALKAGIPDGALALATIETRTVQGLGRLGVLVVAKVFASAGTTPPSGSFFRLVDTGVRCIRAPCFSVRASQLNRPKWTILSGIDLEASLATPRELARAKEAFSTKAGVLAQGQVVVVRSGEGGRVFHATRLFLESQS